MSNYSTEGLTLTKFESMYSLPHTICVSIILSLIIISIIVGNSLVVAAVLTERHLRIVSNYLILSLAIADLLVAIVVMPLSLVSEVSKLWWLGLPLCDVWICADVLLCTVSILHLCAIAIERCLAVSSVRYLHNRSATLVLIMVAICWIVSAMISLPARFHRGRDEMETIRVLYMGECRINTETGYTIYSNLLAFDLPIVFMLAMYAQIYCAVRNHIRKRQFSKYSKTPDSEPCMQRACCCCGYILEAKLNKTGPFRIGLIRCSDFPSVSSSSEKKSASSKYPETVVAAAAAAMQMAATMMTTTKEPTCGESSDSNELKMIQQSQAISTESVDMVGSYDELKPELLVQPITYEAVSKLRPTNKVVDGDANPVPEGGSVINASSYTLASSLAYVDETPRQISLVSSFYSNTVKPPENQLSNSMRLENTDSFESIVAQPSKQSDMLETTCENPGPVAKNFIPLSIYYRKQRQKRWLHQRFSLQQKAKDTMKQLSCSGTGAINPEDEQKNRARLEQRREQRAIRTLAIITGCFVLCWLPFNINALLSPFLGYIHPLGASFLLWLGYMNSLLNPVIYTIFSKEFRGAFRKFICRYRQPRHMR